MAQHTQAELQALLAEFDARDRAIPRRLEGWKRVGRVLQGNAKELIEYLDRVAVPDVPAYAEPETDEVERLFLNFAGSAIVRVEHSRVALKGESAEFEGRYGLLTKVLGNSSDHILLQGIRNYVMHVAAPPLTWVGGLGLRENAGFETVLNFYIDREALRRVEHFSSGHKKAVLDAQDSQIDLRVLVDSYALAAAALDEKVVEAFMELHADELEQDRSMWEQVQTAFTTAGFGEWVGAGS